MSVEILISTIILSGCYSSPMQCKFSLVNIDRRSFPMDLPVASGQVKNASEEKGYGNNGRVFIEQGMILNRSPMNATSNMTPITATIPLIN